MRQFPNLPSSYSSDISVTHVNRLYACANFTLNLVRLRYWIPAGRQHVKKAINHGVTCKTIIGLSYNTLTHLFFQRKDTQEEPFTVSDVDFTRALYIREAVAEKRDYIYFFTRATTKVFYLVVVTDFSVQTFVLAHRGFAARRSVPQQTICDNASTYLSLSKQGVDWRFMPKRAPQHGGFWEGLIGVTPQGFSGIIYNTGWRTVPDCLTCSLQVMKE